MVMYTSDHPDVPGMRGLHLFHAVPSNCSQRVRIGLEEKGLDWTSHLVDIVAGENVSADYVRINPNAVVPTLVHDGQVVLESNDILVYLDETFPAPPLRPDGAEARARIDALVEASGGFQSVIKTLSHERLFRPFREVGDAEIARFEQAGAGEELVGFLRDYAENGDAWRARVEAAEQRLGETLGRFEAALADGPWLSGDAFGLADVSWVVNHHRLAIARVELAPYPKLQAWGERAMARPSFVRAVSEYRG